MKKISKNEQISIWKEKGIDWLADRLWDARKRNESLVKENATQRRRMLSTKCDYKVKRVNDRLAHLLSKAGMKPTQLTVYATEKTCKGCSNYHEEGEDWWCDTDFEGGWGCYYAEQKIIETVTFYDFRLEGDILTGILTDFESKEIEVVKVVATATGEVLCDFSNEKGDK